MGETPNAFGNKTTGNVIKKALAPENGLGEDWVPGVIDDVGVFRPLEPLTAPPPREWATTTDWPEQIQRSQQRPTVLPPDIPPAGEFPKKI